MLLQTPEFNCSADSAAGVCARGTWVEWYLDFHKVPVTTQFFCHPAKNIPDTLEECRVYIRDLATKALTTMIQLTPMAAFPLYELTLTSNEIHEDIIYDTRNRAA